MASTLLGDTACACDALAYRSSALIIVAMNSERAVPRLTAR
jgi:hypothetical protein